MHFGAKNWGFLLLFLTAVSALEGLPAYGVVFLKYVPKFQVELSSSPLEYALAVLSDWLQIESGGSANFQE